MHTNFLINNTQILNTHNFQRELKDKGKTQKFLVWTASSSLAQLKKLNILHWINAIFLVLSHIRCYHRPIRRTIKVQRRLIKLHFLEHPAQCNRNGKQFPTHGKSKNRGMGTEHLPAEKNQQLLNKEQNTSCTEKLKWNLSSLVQSQVWMVGPNISQKSSLPICTSWKKMIPDSLYSL